jgi:hypothetical protein
LSPCQKKAAGAEQPPPRGVYTVALAEEDGRPSGDSSVQRIPSAPVRQLCFCRGGFHMRVYTKMALALGTGIAAVGLVIGQQPGGFGKGGFGAFGKGAGSDPALLLNRADVKKELNVSDEQLKKVPDAVLKALGDVLTPDQLKRLKQINLQVRGAQALNDPNVQTALKMTDEQKDSLKTILSDFEKEIREVAAEAKGGGNFQGVQEKMTTLRKETQEKAMGVLNSDQKKAWKEMVGEEFKMEQGFGGGFGGKKGKKKKGA